MLIESHIRYLANEVPRIALLTNVSRRSMTLHNCGAAYDADYVLKVTTVLDDDPTCFIRSEGRTGLYDPLTRRPIYGELQLCQLDSPVPFTIFLQDVIHELVHNLVRSALHTLAAPVRKQPYRCRDPILFRSIDLTILHQQSPQGTFI